MNIRSPLPDETMNTYVGHLKRKNFCSSDVEFYGRLVSYISVDEPKPRILNPIAILAEMNGVSQHFFIRQHTMLPFKKFVDWFDRDSGSTADFLNAKYLRTALGGTDGPVYFCPECVKEDIDFRGISYWRRTHQLKGVDWCVKHGVSLLQCKLRWAIDWSPASKIGASVMSNDQNLVIARKHPLVQRYAQIVEALLTEVSHPFHITDVSKIIREWVKRQEIGNVKIALRPNLNEIILKAFPRAWLAFHFPLSQIPESIRYYRWIDQSCFDTRKSVNVSAYALVLTLVYQSADEALNELSRIDCGEVRKVQDDQFRASRQTKAGRIKSPKFPFAHKSTT